MLLHLDVYTLIAVLIMGHIVSILLLITDIRQMKSNKFDWIFIIGRVLQLVGWMLIIERGQISEFLSLMIGNSFLMVGQAGEALALTSLKTSITSKWYWVYAGLLGIILLCWWNVVVPLNVLTRITITFPLIGTLFVIPGCFFAFSRDRSSLMQKLIGGIYVSFFIMTIWRAWYTTKLMNYSIFVSHIPHTVSFLMLNFLLIAGSIGYILIKNEQLNQEMVRMANTDFLTNLYNRRAFFNLADSHFSFARREGLAVSMMMIDIDNFKSINDNYGHLVGDRVIHSVATILLNNCRTYDIVSRFGGEEFAVFLPGTDDASAEETAERLRKAVETGIPASHDAIRCTISIGIATLGASKHGPYKVDDLVASSDNALYKAKEMGKNCVAFWGIPELSQ